MLFRKVVCLLLLVFVSVAAPVTCERLLNYEEPYLEADGGRPPPPIPGWAGAASSA